MNKKIHAHFASQKTGHSKLHPCLIVHDMKSLKFRIRTQYNLPRQTDLFNVAEIKIFNQFSFF